jgi:uncharacterized 2Fe-2S/4Fe-4S cluster protein (DUF4445 family)
MHKIVLKPTNVEITAAAGTSLRDLLFEQGVEFPCGGHGRCRGCKVRVLQGDVAVNDAQRQHLKPNELADGWRLSCQCNLDDDLVIELRQWDAAILTNDSAFAFTPRPGLGVAVDLGTTTLVAQLLDLNTSHVLAVRTALNNQARYGADVMSRVGFSVAEKGQSKLQEIIRTQIGKLINDLVFAAQVNPADICDVVIVGNTVMYHIFCGIDLEPMSHYPFEPSEDGLQMFRAADLGWKLGPNTVVRFLPCLGSFVGSDITAGVLATGIHESNELVGLVDLGTNGEIVIGNRERLLCSSTAAGPAFEGARISMGMRAATGAISEVFLKEEFRSQLASVNGQRSSSDLANLYECRVLGSVEPRGICGSGLVDAVAVGLDLSVIKPTGRLNSTDQSSSGEKGWALCPPVVLSQTDIRELQLAKGAIAAGIHLLLQQWGANEKDLTRLYLAGAFGNYISRSSARRIGLLKFPLEKVQPAGNTALLGAKLGLFLNDEDVYTTIRAKVKHVGLNEDPSFQDAYVDEMSFPADEEA